MRAAEAEAFENPLILGDEPLPEHRAVPDASIVYDTPLIREADWKAPRDDGEA